MKTSNEVDVQIIGKIFCPVSLVVSPIGLILIIIAPLVPGDIPTAYSYFKVISICVFGFWSSFWYCKTRMGWFQKSSKMGYIFGMASSPLLSIFLFHVVKRAIENGERIETESIVLFLALITFSFWLPIYIYKKGKLAGLF